MSRQRAPANWCETNHCGREPMRDIQGTVVVAGDASGPLCRLAKPISLWGGVDPATGRVIDPRHPDHGRLISGTILVLASTIGSSSSSAVMLELLRRDTAPAALLLGTVDAIMTLGIIVARELGYPSIPVVRLESEALDALPTSGSVRVTKEGVVAPIEDRE